MNIIKRASTILGINPVLKVRPVSETKNYVFLELPSSIAEQEVFMSSLPGKYANIYVAVWNAYRCISMIARNGATLPIKLRRVSDNKIVDSHPVLDIYTRRANKMQSGPAYIESNLSWLLIDGNSYDYLVAGTPERPAEMWPLRAVNVTPVKGDSENPIKHYKYHNQNTGKPEQYMPEEILHNKTFNPLSDISGLSPTGVASTTINSQSMATNWNASLLKKWAKPSMYAIVKEPLKTDQLEFLKAQLREKHQGHQNTGNILIVPAAVDQIIKGELSPIDLDFMNLKKMSLREIANTYGVPSQLVGDTESETYSNYREARLAFYIETVIPMTVSFLREANRYHFPKNDFEMFVDMQNVEAIQIAMTEKVKALKDANWLSQNEKRIEMGYSEITIASKNPMDRIYIDSRIIPIEDAGIKEPGEGEGDE